MTVISAIPPGLWDCFWFTTEKVLVVPLGLFYQTSFKSMGRGTTVDSLPVAEYVYSNPAF